MEKNTARSPTMVLLIFITQVLLNWAYILWVQYQPDIILNSWFVVIPLVGYFYFTLAFISAAFLYQMKKLGLSLGYCVNLFGTISTVISFLAAGNKNVFISFLIIPLIIVNACVIIYMAYHQASYQNN
jgi:hypothetical protein